MHHFLGIAGGCNGGTILSHSFVVLVPHLQFLHVFLHGDSLFKTLQFLLQPSFPILANMENNIDPVQKRKDPPLLC